MFMAAFVDIARRDNLTLSVSTRGFCPWQRDLYPTVAGDYANLVANGATGIDAAGCKALRDDLYTRVLPALHPDIVVGVDIDNGWYPDPAAATISSLPPLARDGRKVILVEDIPVADSNPLTCLSQATVLEECRYVASSSPTPVELFDRQLAVQEPGVVYSADFDRLVCPFLPICDSVIDGHIVKYDPSHLTVAFSKSIAPQIEGYLEQTVLQSSH
jgi:hypothetical protein